VSEAVQKKRRPVKRWLILALIALGAYFAFFGPNTTKPISPVVILPAEPTGLHIGGFQITNSILATLITDVLLLLMGWSAYRFARKGSLVPTGFYNAFEAIVQFLYDGVEGMIGKWTKRVFPLVATIFLLIFVANMIKLVPGFESIGRLETSHSGIGYTPVELFKIGELGVFTVVKPDQTAAAAETVAHTGEGEHEGVCTANCEIIPFLRGTATDLNFPLALAIIAVVMSQVYGVWALGPGYFGKFLQFRQLVEGGVFGVIDFLVGFLEMILEFAKILSFSFRLFGNIFAGALLLSILGALLPVALPPLLYVFEIFFGIIQAYVFYLLATAFISMALISHHAEGQEEGH
jgi:F-type H+-transporting ATPase subunit a